MTEPRGAIALDDLIAQVPPDAIFELMTSPVRGVWQAVVYDGSSSGRHGHVQYGYTPIEAVQSALDDYRTVQDAAAELKRRLDDSDLKSIGGPLDDYR